MDKVKTISILLDLDSICDIDDEKIIVFLHQLEVLRNKFSADVATISISTNDENINKIKEIIKKIIINLNKYKLVNIEIGISFYMHGIYDFKNNLQECKEFKFNENKISKFEQMYLENDEYDNQWFFIVTNDTTCKIYRKYKNIQPLLQCHPSSLKKELKKNNFMRIATVTDNFNGIIEILDYYIECTSELNKEQIIEKQKSIINYKEQLEEIKIYLKETKTISNIELISLNHMLEEMYEEAKENNDIKNTLRIKTLQKNLIVK